MSNSHFGKSTIPEGDAVWYLDEAIIVTVHKPWRLLNAVERVYSFTRAAFVNDVCLWQATSLAGIKQGGDNI